VQRTYSIVNIGNSNFSQQFLCCLEELSHERRWHGRRLPIKFQLSESKGQIEITSKLLLDEAVEGIFINHLVKVRESNIQYENVLSDEFNKLILLCGLKDLLEKSVVRNIINGYRMMMNYQGRSNDVYLCLIDNDSVLTYRNEDDEEQLQLDFFQLIDDKEHCKFILSSKYKVLLNELELQDFGQYIVPIPRHHSEVVKICKNLFVHLSKDKYSGYIEVAQIIFNDLLESIGYKITKFSRNQKYNYMFNIMSLLKKMFSTKPAQANIAVVGTASAGKTLLINDMMIAMNTMGYKAGEALTYTSVGCLRNEIRNREQDPIYAMRNSYIYDSIYSPKDSSASSKNINFTFVNIPGEIFDRTRLAICADIYKAISKIKNKSFTKRVIELPTGQTVCFLEYFPISHENLHQSGDFNMTKKKYSYLPTADNYSFNKIFQENYEETYAKGKTSKVSGKEVLKEYFLYDTDSVVNAIYDAWINLITGVGITKEEFFTDYSRDFSFHMYLQMATDMVICDKLIGMGGKIMSNYNSALNDMLAGINTYLANNPSHMNIYMAFRAVDAAINDKNLVRVFDEISQVPSIVKARIPQKSVRLSNALYSYFIYCMAKKNDAVDENIYNISNVTSDDSVKISDIDVIDKDNELLQHATSAIKACNKAATISIITHVVPTLSSHIYYTATPIDENAKIYKNTSTKETKAEFAGFDDTLSLCFGSMQLCIDILKRHNRFIYEDEDTYGRILDTVLE